MNRKTFTLINATLVDPEGDYQGLGSLTVENGLIRSVNGPSLGKEIDCKEAFLAPGIIDMGVKICEPGERHKESFKSAGAAAAAVAGIGRHALPDFLLVRHLAHVTGTSLVGDEDGGHHEL